MSTETFQSNKQFIIEESRKQLYQRLYIVIIVFIFSFVVVTSKLFKVSLTNNSVVSANYPLGVLARKEIVDRNGALLAVDLSIVSLYANPKLLPDYRQVAAKLVKIFPELKVEALTKAFEGNKNFVWIKRNITPKQQHQVHSLGFHGLQFEKGTKRVYTQGNLFSHILGYVDTDGNGIAGIEKYLDKEIRDVKDKQKLQLSVDVRVQSIVHDEMLKSINEFKARGGVGIVMDAYNGELISMVSLPDFDPHFPNLASPERLFNQASLGVYEIGSIMKGLTIAMALENKTVSPRDVYYVKEPIKAARFTIHDFRLNFTHLSVPQIFMHSSNIGTAMISLELGGKRQRKFLESLGFFSPLNIELPERGLPIYPREKNWSEISTMTISFGHGIAITPLHYIRGAVALVNGGYVCEPTLLKANNKEGQIFTRVFSEDTSGMLRKLMRLTVQYGSGKKLKAEDYLPGGKTGSAEKAVRGGYSKNQKLSLFFSAFPINKPRYVTLMILDDPRPNATTPFTGGGWTAAPLTGRIINRIAPILNVQPVNANDPKIKDELWLDYDPDAESKEKSF